MILSKFKNFKICHVYRCNRDIPDYGIKEGDFISILNIESRYDRHHDKHCMENAVYSFVSKFVVLNDFEYTPSSNNILTERMSCFFDEVDMFLVSVELHNAYVKTMKATPMQLGIV